VVEDNESKIMIVTLQDLSELRGLFITPVKEEVYEKIHMDNVSLENGFIYLIPSHEAADGYKLFTNVVKSGTPGLCITRQNPEKIREQYKLTKTPMIWLTKNKISGQQVIDPSELFKIYPTILDFISKANDGVILLDGLEYLTLFNDVRSVVKLIEQTNDAIMASSSRMILQLDPDVFDKKEYHLLKRWMKLLYLEDKI
jgi:two-component system cell cycle response regulator